MKEEVLKSIHEKIKENFTFEFPPFILEDEFERDFSTYTEILWLSLSSKIIEYQNLLNSEDTDTYKELIKLDPEYFIKNYRQIINSAYIYEKFVILEPNGKLRSCSFEEKKRKPLSDLDDEMKMRLYNQIINSRLERTDILLVSEREWLTSLEEYIQQRHSEIIQIKVYENLSVLFKDVSFSSICKCFENLDTVKTKFHEIVKDCKQRYVNAHNKYWTLLNTSAKYIKMENISPFTSWIVNVGTKNWKWNHNTLVNLYSVINKKNVYSFEYKNEAKQIEYIYVNLFLLKENCVTKISVGPTKLIQKTPYLIAKDIQRVDIIEGNIIELHMHKHFDPEAIVFDTDEEAYKFQTKVSEKRDSRRESRR